MTTTPATQRTGLQNEFAVIANSFLQQAGIAPNSLDAVAAIP
jgi:hypothetical protein